MASHWIAMTAKDFEKMLERKLQPLVTSLDTLTKSVDFMSTKYDKLLQKVAVLEQANTKQSKKYKDLKESNTKSPIFLTSSRYAKNL